MSVEAVNDGGICDESSCEAFHLAPDQLINLGQILQHYDHPCYRDRYNEKSHQENTTELDFGPEGKTSPNNDGERDGHQQRIRGDICAPHGNYSIHCGGTVWPLLAVMISHVEI